jgi:hypothetical protein
MIVPFVPSPSVTEWFRVFYTEQYLYIHKNTQFALITTLSRSRHVLIELLSEKFSVPPPRRTYHWELVNQLKQESEKHLPFDSSTSQCAPLAPIISYPATTTSHCSFLTTSNTPSYAMLSQLEYPRIFTLCTPRAGHRDVDGERSFSAWVAILGASDSSMSMSRWTSRTWKGILVLAITENWMERPGEIEEPR